MEVLCKLLPASSPVATWACSPHAVTAKEWASQQTRTCSYFLRHDSRMAKRGGVGCWEQGRRRRREGGREMVRREGGEEKEVAGAAFPPFEA